MATFDPYLKRREALVMGIEATRGTAATPQYSFRWMSKGVKPVPSVLENESGVGNDYRVNDSAIAHWHSEGPLSGKVTEEGIGYLERLIMPGYSVADNGDGTYTHTFNYDSTVAPKSASLWDVRPSSTRLYKSCLLDNLSVSVESGDSGAWLMAEANVKGFAHEDTTVTEPALVDGETEFTDRNVKVYLADNLAGLDAAPQLVNVRKLQLDREQAKNVNFNIGVANPEFDKEPFEAKGSMTVTYNTTDFEDDFFTNAVHAMKVVIENNGTTLTYTGSKVRFRELTDSDDRDQVVTQEISLYFESDSANGGKAITTTLTNGIATYEAA